jgi:hypothetical protein
MISRIKNYQNNVKELYALDKQKEDMIQKTNYYETQLSDDKIEKK